MKRVKTLDRDRSVRFDLAKSARCLKGAYWFDFGTEAPAISSQKSEDELVLSLNQSIRQGRPGLFLLLRNSGRITVTREHHEQLLTNLVDDDSVMTSLSLLYSANDIDLMNWFFELFIEKYRRGEKVSLWNIGKLTSLICNFPFEGHSKASVERFRQLAKELIGYWLKQGRVTDASKAAWGIGLKISYHDFVAAFETSCSLCYEAEVRYGMKKLGIKTLPRKLAASLLKGYFSWGHQAQLNYVFLMKEPCLSANFTLPELQSLLSLARESGSKPLAESFQSIIQARKERISIKCLFWALARRFFRTRLHEAAA